MRLIVLKADGIREIICERAGNRAAMHEGNAAHVADSEQHARVGLEPHELRDVMAEWLNIDDSDEYGNGFLAINNCMNEVCHGFRIASEDWATWFDTPKAEIKTAYQKWLALREIPGGIR